MNRRQFLLASSAAAVTASSQPFAALAAAPKLKIGFIYPGPVADIGWSFQHDLGRRMLEKEFGARIETVFVERVPETPEAERVMRQLIDDGCKMIFATSFGFMNPVLRVAKENPDVIFEHCSGYTMARNVGLYQTRFYEGAYVLGTIAGRMTKTNTLGYVAPIPIPEVIRNLDAFVLGARSVNPKVNAKVVWINAWYDPSLERDAAQTLAAQGADVFYQNTDSPAPVQVAESKGLYAFGQDSDMSRFGPRAHLTGNTLNWGVYYVHKVRQVLEGQWKAEDTKWGMKEGIVQLAPYNAGLPKEVVAQAEERRKAIVAGTLQPFAGPINNQGGQLQVAAGRTVPESELWTMKWYVEGIQGKQP
ncbi:BMP family ABC transporter substrate-binding protein [Herbaspirillum sp. VT-16-41]|uniref:BMP family ABC transporter substrate-binding protein n=1 Tax=Herbaspirillum sp. VT-16-41 TaxID=1953765 RepID=UPI000981C63A|nr:BMP family ABC transporter substrate-binding protein [Herbaspirillum sp. VT-16-41]ONN64409.1 BMP family ABC transporter substrate-binding protein [Herbaspirillum sp. VT-16-41]